MDMQTIMNKARALMDAHGLKHWKLKELRSVYVAGNCNYSIRTIGLSNKLLPKWDDAEVTDTILHEIAHALVGPGHGHDDAWRNKCLSIGAKPERCYSSELPKADKKWTALCPCGAVNGTQVHRRRKGMVCSHCREDVKYHDGDPSKAAPFHGTVNSLQAKCDKRAEELGVTFGNNAYWAPKGKVFYATGTEILDLDLPTYQHHNGTIIWRYVWEDIAPGLEMTLTLV